MGKAVKVACVYLGVNLLLLDVVGAAPVSFDVAGQRNMVSPQAKGPPVFEFSSSLLDLKGHRDLTVNQKDIPEDKLAQEDDSAANDGFPTLPSTPDPFERIPEPDQAGPSGDVIQRSPRVPEDSRPRVARSPVAAVIQEGILPYDPASILALPLLPCPERCEVRNIRGQCVLDFKCLLRTHQQ